MSNSNLLNKAVLCKVSISAFNPKRQDSKITNEVLVERGAQSNAGNWVKNLIDPKKLDNIVKVSQKTRMDSYRLSLPFQDEGYRILPTTLYLEYQKVMRERRQEFEVAVDRFVDNYDQYVLEAKQALHGMFNPKEYLTKEEVRNKFDFNVDILPLPSGGHFLVDLAQEEVEQVKADCDKLVKDAEKEAMKDLWNRLATPIRHMVDKLSQNDGVFRDSLIRNVQEIIKLIPALNISNDPVLLNLTQECKKLTEFSADTLRINKDLRKDVASQANDILKKMEGYL